jgi:hypothetical protein
MGDMRFVLSVALVGLVVFVGCGPSSPQEKAIAALRKLGASFEFTTGVVLSGTKVTDAGLVHLSGLTNLERLNLSGTNVTDAGLVHLKGLTQLSDLNLQGTTKVTHAACEPGNHEGPAHFVHHCVCIYHSLFPTHLSE